MLKIIKYPAYLSPSSLGAWEKQPNKFYLQRMAPNPWPFDPQGLAAAVGSAFDARIKQYYCQLLGKEDEVKELVIKDSYVSDAEKDVLRQCNFYEALCKTNIDKGHYDEAVQVGQNLYQFVSRTPFVRRPIEKLEVHYNFILYGLFNVPLFMKLDAAVRDEDGQLCPMDWKVNGYGSQASPKKGFKELYDGMSIVEKHKDYREEMCLSEIDRSWATQMCIYGWGLGRKIGEPFRAYIDNLVIRKTGVRAVHYCNWISSEFQGEVAQRLRVAWEGIKSNSFVQSLGNERVFVEMAAREERWY